MEKATRIEEIINVELSGISKIILEYSTNPFIVNYAEKVKNKEFCSNKKLLKYVTNELCEWYTSEIDEIQTGEYIINKDLHNKCFQILKELNELLKI